MKSFKWHEYNVYVTYIAVRWIQIELRVNKIINGKEKSFVRVFSINREQYKDFWNYLNDSVFKIKQHIRAKRILNEGKTDYEN